VALGAITTLLPPTVSATPVADVAAVVADRPPSVLVLMTDDQRWDTLWAMPNVRRRLARQGARFDDAFVVAPACCPSRASFLTGAYPRDHDVWDNDVKHGGGFHAFDDSSTIATWLDRVGYRTALIGKYLNGYDPSAGYVPPGWDRWFGMKPGGHYGWQALDADDDGARLVEGTQTRRDYSTRRLTRTAVRFIDDVPADEPFFATVSFTAPHAPFVPDPADAGAFADLQPARPPSFDERNMNDKPDFLQKGRLSRRAIARLDEGRRLQLEMLLGVDRAVDRIVDALAAAGRLGDTMVVFVSDNGYLWGEHRREGKSLPYEESIRVPLVIRYDPLVAEGLRPRRPALQIDLAPTFADLAGVPAPGAEGESLLPALSGADDPDRTFVVELGVRKTARRPFCAIREPGMLYARYFDDGVVIEEELYDLRSDPYQLHNAIATGNRPADTERLREAADAACVTPG
jgi:arylsulfatase A-like enzyme